MYSTPFPSVTFPLEFVNVLSLLTGIFRFDLTIMLGLGCMNKESYLASLAATCALVVVIMMAEGILFLFKNYEVSHPSRRSSELEQREHMKELGL